MRALDVLPLRFDFNCHASSFCGFKDGGGTPSPRATDTSALRIRSASRVNGPIGVLFRFATGSLPVAAHPLLEAYIRDMPSSLRFIRACSPIRATKPPAGDAWLHELKLDGYRLQIVKDRREVRVFTRRGAEWTERLAAFADAFVALACRSAILDGELVLPDKTGAPDFRGLHRAMASSRHHELVFFAFDLLHRDGQDLRPLPLIERRRRLARLIADRRSHACTWLKPSMMA